MKSRPILFSGPMVRAILDGRKTQTRRAVQPQPVFEGVESFGDSWKWQKGKDGFSGVTAEQLAGPAGLLYNGRSFYGHPKDRLRVKEAAWMWCEKVKNGKTKSGRQKYRYYPLETAPVIYCADRPAKPQTDIISPDTGNPFEWRKKIGRFLPRWASRLTLEIVSVRVERVQDITTADAQAEGAELWFPSGELCQYLPEGSYRNGFHEIWESIHGHESWYANPWVWVVEFKRVDQGAAS